MSAMESTKKHITQVEEMLEYFALTLEERGLNHDSSKLQSPEMEVFEKVTPQLRNLTYGSVEYKNQLKEMDFVIQHHYENNRHHPEHFENGIHGMNLIDLLEMFCDWCAAVKRHKDGSFTSSLEVNKKRFKMSEQLESIFKNTYEVYKDVL